MGLERTSLTCNKSKRFNMRTFVLILATLSCILAVNAKRKLDFFRETEQVFEDFYWEAAQIFDHIAFDFEEIFEKSKIGEAFRKMDWDRYGSLFRKAFRDALFKDLSKSVEKVNFEPVKDISLKFLNMTQDLIKDINWKSVADAGIRIFNATEDVLEDINNHMNEV